MPVEAHDIVLIEADGGGPRDLIPDLLRQVGELFTPSENGLGKWLKGRGGDDLARAESVRYRVLTAIAEFEPQRQAMVRERAAVRATTPADMARTSRRDAELLLSIVDRLFKLRDLGVEVDLAVVGKALVRALDQEA